MEDYTLIGWPEIQAYIDEEGFEEHSALVAENFHMGIGTSTYLVDKEWLKTL